MIYLFFLFGLCVGSFLNVVILRMEKKDFSFAKLKSRSKCPHCKKTLLWYDLIPLISFFILGGRCRFCKKQISFQYPLVEFFTGLLFYLIFLKFGLSWQLTILYPLTSILVVLFVFDLKTMMLPDIFAWIAIGLAILYLILQALVHNSYFLFLNSAIAAAIAGGFFALLVLVSREKWMGRGDIYLGVILGLMLGYPQVLVGLFSAFTLGALFSIILLSLKKTTLKAQIAFGPFVILATFIAFFWGEKILQWYLNI